MNNEVGQNVCYMKQFLFPLFLLYIFSCRGQSNEEIINILLHSPDKELDVLFCNKDWEQQMDYTTVLKVDSHYVMYYRAICEVSIEQYENSYINK